ncbi:MAG: hypothetical protein IKO93_22975 [Lentisphaeria bacterium]|nr:hypothetical protein [Lentisphaeria bacterium]
MILNGISDEIPKREREGMRFQIFAETVEHLGIQSGEQHLAKSPRQDFFGIFHTDAAIIDGNSIGMERNDPGIPHRIYHRQRQGPFQKQLQHRILFRAGGKTDQSMKRIGHDLVDDPFRSLGSRGNKLAVNIANRVPGSSKKSSQDLIRLGTENGQFSAQDAVIFFELPPGSAGRIEKKIFASVDLDQDLVAEQPGGGAANGQTVDLQGASKFAFAKRQRFGGTFRQQTGYHIPSDFRLGHTMFFFII